jgi:hypothetical protein
VGQIMRVDPDRWHAVYKGLVDEIDVIADQILARLRAELPSYANLSPQALRPGVMTIVRLSLTAFDERRSASRTDLEEAGRAGENRASVGVPVDEMLRAFRIGAQEVWAHQHEMGRREGLDEATLLEIAQAAWEWTDLVMAHAAKTHRRVELEMASHDLERRANLLRSILFGSVGAAELQLQAAAYGLVPDRAYHPFRARVTGDASLHELERAILSSGSVEARAILVGVVDGDLAGVLPRRPSIDCCGVVGVGPPAKLIELEPAFRLASSALEVASAFGMEGVFDLHDLALHAAIFHEHHLGERLVERYAQPLDRLGAFGRTIETTLEAFFRHGMRVEPTARSLFVHPNTLRHRLRRFEETTGADLGRSEDLFGVWWALERRRLHR